MRDTTQESALTLQVYTSTDGFDALHGEWESLLDASPTHEIFLTWEWQSIWWTAYHPGDLYLIAVRDALGVLIGIAPWFIEQPTRTLRTIGCVDVTDYCDLIVHRDHQADVYATLATWLAEHADQFESISLCNIPAASPTLIEFTAELGKNGFQAESIKQEVCPIIDLPDTFDAYLESLDKKNRHEIRRKLRRAQDGEDNVSWYFVDETRDVYAETDAFLVLTAASHRDKANFWNSGNNALFCKALVPALMKRGWLKLSFLLVDDVRVATYLAVDYDNRIGLYNSGFLPDKYSQLSPGIVLLAYIIRDAIEQKRSVFDFLRGNEDYKYRMGAHDTEVRELVARRGTLPTSPDLSVAPPDQPISQN